ncbi:MAG: dihydrolipoyl dehydrogenase [Acidobacteria bacterium RIFCSPLOWO2_12_FULL_59_11]|nr:MAG: dihydrolipoyl dehydrogenase [Acidobacteria bacterium RIFCSPLOWO2_12_FULL_59_11]
MADEFDLVILGSGPGGYVAAIRAAQWGLRTAVVEKDDRLGGTCLNVGCIPTKALLFNAEIYDYVKRAKEFGIECGEAKIQWETVRARQDQVVRKHNKGLEFLFRKHKIETIRGFGKLQGSRSLRVEGPEGGRDVRASNLILATGSEARMLPGLEADGERILTNREILAISSVPESLLIIGAGAVGVEFASIFRRFGSGVVLVEMLPRILPLADEEISQELERSFKKQGIRVLTNTRVEKVAKKDSGVEVVVTQGDSRQTFQVQKTLVAVGRKPNTEGIGLETTRVETERGFIKTDSHMQTAEPGIYAIGDIVAGMPQLAHAASMEGIVAVGKICGKNVPPVNRHRVPDCVYCEPQAASVGLTEAQAKGMGHPVRVGKFSFRANSKASILGAEEGFVKLVCEEKHGEILGAHLIGPSVTEMIAELALAMRLEVTAEDIMYTIHAHPTLTEAVCDAANSVYSLTINA